VRQTINGFYRTESKITDFIIHPSNQYLLLVAKHLYIYHIHSFEMRAKIILPPSCQNVVVDASGLYAAVSSCDSVYLCEVGTGKIIAKFKPNFCSVGAFDFSACARFIVVTDAVSAETKLYKLDSNFTKKATRVTKMMDLDEKVWERFPIQLLVE
jgi:hypothetical protein